jgi:serine/threonine protein phosphatase PrpC
MSLLLLLQTWGVSHEPTVYTLNLCDAPKESNVGGVGCIILCTDGIWDNWTYKDAVGYVMDPARLARVRASTDADGEGGAEGGGTGVDVAEALVREFMSQNLVYAKQNFGSSMDNMTALLCFIEQQ